ncbi:hypothetical protein BDZ91DRAFT_718942 [Kalaharituber pfeilii]|nr:hypothetical protein BDZ91DRAFT_718942 [Kalaharituber pfeilii]
MPSCFNRLVCLAFEAVCFPSSLQHCTSSEMRNVSPSYRRGMSLGHIQTECSPDSRGHKAQSYNIEPTSAPSMPSMGGWEVMQEKRCLLFELTYSSVKLYVCGL